jgi:hypothetical protein
MKSKFKAMKRETAITFLTTPESIQRFIGLSNDPGYVNLAYTL